MTTPILEGTVSVVTGASRGIGRTIATTLAASGAAVAAVARSANQLRTVVEEIEASGGRAIAVAADVTDEREVAGAVSAVAADLGPIDLVVNNAGGCTAVGPLWELSFEEWWQDVHLNIRSAAVMAHAVLPSMIARGAGRVVNLGSILATGPSPYQSAYAAAKVALLQLTESLEQALAGTGVHAFVMSPGLVRTPGFEQTVLTDRGARWLPEIAAVDPTVMVEPTAAAGLLLRIAAGDCDDLAGRFLHVRDDVDDLRARAAELAREELLVMRLRTG